MNTKRNLIDLTITILVLISAACTSSTPGSSSSPSIEGTWEGSYESDSITWVFGSDGEFNVTVNGSEVARGQYEVDYSMEPYQLDLVYENGFLVYTIFELTDSDTMRMESALPDPDGSRPTSFTDYAVFQRADQ